MAVMGALRVLPMLVTYPLNLPVGGPGEDTSVHARFPSAVAAGGEGRADEHGLALRNVGPTDEWDRGAPRP
jgi:hypothetical protein